MKIYFYFVLLLIFSMGCESSSSDDGDFLSNENLSLEEKIERCLNLKKNDWGISSKEVVFLKQIFQSRNYKSTCLLNDSTPSKDGIQIFENSLNPLAFGVSNYRMIPLPSKLKHPIEKELICLINVSRILQDVKNGFFDYVNRKEKPRNGCELKTIQTYLSFNSLKSRNKFIINQGKTTDTTYLHLAQGIFEFYQKYKVDSVDIDLTTLKKLDSSNLKLITKRGLFAKGILKDTLALDYELNKALKVFKKINGLADDLVLDDYTLEALSESNLHKLNRAAISLDKLRQRLPRGAKYIWINLPEYRLYFYSKNKLQSVNRVVVGKRKTRTPELQSQVYSIVSMPYWKVPPSIIKNEIMPNVYKNPGYLKKHHYKLCKFDDTTGIDPETINWSTRPGGFNIIQEPGSHNSLGLIKFEFINKHSVYVHDTPQKRYFSKAVRSYSHGCMRCEDPIELGKLIVSCDQELRRKNSFTADTLDSIIRVGKHKSFALKEKIPIFVGYDSVVYSENRLVFHLDIYFQDDEIIESIKKHKNKA